MKIISIKQIPPLIFGTWVLKKTNDVSIEKGLNVLQINASPFIKFQTRNQAGLFSVKKSTIAIIQDITTINHNSFNCTFNYFINKAYSYSFLGIEIIPEIIPEIILDIIPEINTKSIYYNKIKPVMLTIYNKTLIVIDDTLNLFYIFELNIGNCKVPNIETSLTTFLFTQIISILFGAIVTKNYYL
jgi:hypothetical protein